MDMTYYGMASCNGLESIIKDEDSVNKFTKLGSRFGDMIFGEEENKQMSNKIKMMIGGMTMSAQFNPHRRSVVYRAVLSSEDAEEIQDMLREDPVTALLLLKSQAKEIALAQTPNAKKFWEQIPNPE